MVLANLIDPHQHDQSEAGKISFQERIGAYGTTWKIWVLHSIVVFSSFYYVEPSNCSSRNTNYLHQFIFPFMCCIDNLFLQQSYFPYYSMNTISSDKHLPDTINYNENITLVHSLILRNDFRTDLRNRMSWQHLF